MATTPTSQPLNSLEWNFKKNHVDAAIFKDGQDFISSESILFCAAPAQYSPNPEDYWPIGVLENASVIQNKQIQQLFEIGSKLPYYIPGRTICQVGLSRVFINGPSLLKALTLETKRTSKDTADNFNIPGDPWKADPDFNYKEDYNPNTDSWFFINLQSEFFNRPMGIVMLVHDSENDRYGGAYFTECYIQSHQMTLTAAQTVVMENCSIRVTEIIPIDCRPISVKIPPVLGPIE